MPDMKQSLTQPNPQLFTQPFLQLFPQLLPQLFTQSLPQLFTQSLPQLFTQLLSLPLTESSEVMTLALVALDKILKLEGLPMLKRFGKEKAIKRNN